MGRAAVLVVALGGATGCGDRAAGPLRSEPTTPTVELGAAGPATELVWSDLATLFPDDGPALPQTLGALVPGRPTAEAVAVLEAAREPKVAIRHEEVGGHHVARSVLRDRPTVGVSLVFDPGDVGLEQVNVSLPADEALAVLGDRWGGPAVADGADGEPVFRWAATPGGAWSAELETMSPERAVLSFRAPR